jgi:hypothetical protein
MASDVLRLEVFYHDLVRRDSLFHHELMMYLSICSKSVRSQTAASYVGFYTVTFTKMSFYRFIERFYWMISNVASVTWHGASFCWMKSNVGGRAEMPLSNWLVVCCAHTLDFIQPTSARLLTTASYVGFLTVTFARMSFYRPNALILPG